MGTSNDGWCPAPPPSQTAFDTGFLEEGRAPPLCVWEYCGSSLVPWEGMGIVQVAVCLHSSVVAECPTSQAPRGVHSMDNNLPVLPQVTCPAPPSHLLLCNSQGRGWSVWTSCPKWAASVQLAGGFAGDSSLLVAPLQSRAVHPCVPVSADTAIWAESKSPVCAVWCKALHSPEILTGPCRQKGLFQGKAGQERPSNPLKETPVHSSRQTVT